MGGTGVLLGLVWGVLVPSWGRLWALLELSWGPLGSSGAPPGAILEAIDQRRGGSPTQLHPLGALSPPLGAILGRSWGRLGALLGPSWGPLGPSWGPLGLSWGLLGRSWSRLGATLGVLRRRAAMLKNHRKTQVGKAFGPSKMSPSCSKLRSSCDLEPS